MRKRIGQLMIVFGICIILVPVIGSVYTYYEARRLYEEYLQNIQVVQPAYNNKEDKEDHTDVSETDHETSNTPKTFMPMEVIGKIKIPGVQVDLLLIEGVSNKALKLGAAHMEGTALPGDIGSCAIAGHRNYTFGQMFNRLGDVHLNDEIIIEVSDNTYVYKVNDIQIVKPDEVSVLQQQKDKKQILLITCHPIYTGTHRLIVRGELTEDDGQSNKDDYKEITAK